MNTLLRRRLGSRRSPRRPLLRAPELVSLIEDDRRRIAALPTGPSGVHAWLDLVVLWSTRCVVAVPLKRPSRPSSDTSASTRASDGRDGPAHARGSSNR